MEFFEIMLMAAIADGAVWLLYHSLWKKKTAAVIPAAADASNRRAGQMTCPFFMQRSIFFTNLINAN